MKSIVLDVDGVLANAEDPAVEYYDRAPYPDAVAAVRRLKAAGFFVRVQTARGMDRFDGDLAKVRDHHERRLADWLRRHDIPFDEVYFGKAVTSTYYVDDRAFSVRSADGNGDWDRLLAGLGVEA